MFTIENTRNINVRNSDEAVSLSDNRSNYSNTQFGLHTVYGLKTVSFLLFHKINII